MVSTILLKISAPCSCSVPLCVTYYYVLQTMVGEALVVLTLFTKLPRRSPHLSLLHTHTHTHKDVAYKFEDLLAPPPDDREGDASDATLTYDQEDSELTLDYEEDDLIKGEEEKAKKALTLHSEDKKKEVESKKRKLGEEAELPPSAKRMLSCARKEPPAHSSPADVVKEEEEGKSCEGKSVNEASAESSKAAAGTAKPSMEKKDSMEENLICQICQVCLSLHVIFKHIL